MVKHNNNKERNAKDDVKKSISSQDEKVNISDSESNNKIRKKIDDLFWLENIAARTNLVCFFVATICGVVSPVSASFPDSMVGKRISVLTYWSNQCSLVLIFILYLYRMWLRETGCDLLKGYQRDHAPPQKTLGWYNILWRFLLLSFVLYLHSFSHDFYERNPLVPKRADNKVDAYANLFLVDMLSGMIVPIYICPAESVQTIWDD